MVPKKVVDQVLPVLTDVGDRRIDAMDQAGIDVMVLSNTAIVQGTLDAAPALRLAKEADDALAEAVRANPDRLAGFATVPLQDPSAGADELERAVAELGLHGTMVFGHTNGEYLDDPRFDPFWERLEHLDVPMYLHAADPQVVPRSYDGVAPLEGPVWSWAAETTTHVLRMILGGVLDRHPKAQIVLGHMGETLPYMLWRLDRRTKAFNTGDPLPVPSETFRRNFSVTSAGVFSDDPFRCALAAVGEDRVLFSVDYPFESLGDGVSWLDQVDVESSVREKVAHGNAERLLELDSA